MKTLFKIAGLAVSALALAACSGKVQTNDIPSQKNIHLPKDSDIKLQDTIPQSYIEDYDSYAKEFFKATPEQLKRNIFGIGLNRGHYND